MTRSECDISKPFFTSKPVDKDDKIERLQARVEELEVKAQDKEILRAFFEAVCDDNWSVANGIREALTGAATEQGESDA